MRGLLDNGYILTQLVNKEWVIDEFDELQYDNKTIEHKKIGKWEHIQRGKIEGEVRRGFGGGVYVACVSACSVHFPFDSPLICSRPLTLLSLSIAG